MYLYWVCTYIQLTYNYLLVGYYLTTTHIRSEGGGRRPTTEHEGEVRNV